MPSGDIDRTSDAFIRWAQRSLNQVAAAGLVVDGVAGPATRAAISHFQATHGLAVIGSVGPLTQAALVAAGALPFPVSSFWTDVIMKDSRFDSADRVDDVGLLEPVTRRQVQAILTEASGAGHSLMVFETYRSQARQEQLFADGKTKLRHVGVHHFGLACDIVFRVAGQPSWTGDFALLGKLAHGHGLIWGGDWGQPEQPNDFVDADHVQRSSLGRQPALFRGEWYPDAVYDPYDDLP